MPQKKSNTLTNPEKAKGKRQKVFEVKLWVTTRTKKLTTTVTELITGGGRI